MDTPLDIEVILENLNLFNTWVLDWVLTQEFIIQCSITFVSLLVAAYLSRYTRRVLPLPDKPSRRHPFSPFFRRLIRRMAFSVVLLLLLGWGMLMFRIYEVPHEVLTRASHLTLAWLLIRMGSTFISNPTISRFITSVIWFMAALSILGYLPLTIAWLDGIKLSSGEGSLSVYDVMVSTLSVAGFVWVALLLSKMVEHALQNKFGLSLSAQALLGKLTQFALLGIASLVGLSVVGVDLTAFAVLGGAIAVGIGLGLQKVFSNLIAGIILLSDNSIKPGDTIVSAGRYGKVNKLNARYISMITRDGTEYLIPNDELINNRVENWSHSDENVRMKCPIGVHYKADIHLAIELCIEAARETPRVLKYPKPVCLLKGFGASSVDLELRFWIRDPMNGCSNVKSQVLLAIWDKFHEKGIEIPYPQRDLHIRSTENGNIPDELVQNL